MRVEIQLVLNTNNQNTAKHSQPAPNCWWRCHWTSPCKAGSCFCYWLSLCKSSPHVSSQHTQRCNYLHEVCLGVTDPHCGQVPPAADPADSELRAAAEQSLGPCCFMKELRTSLQVESMRLGSQQSQHPALPHLRFIHCIQDLPSSFFLVLDRNYKNISSFSWSFLCSQ